MTVAISIEDACRHNKPKRLAFAQRLENQCELGCFVSVLLIFTNVNTSRDCAKAAGTNGAIVSHRIENRVDE